MRCLRYPHAKDTSALAFSEDGRQLFLLSTHDQIWRRSVTDGFDQRELGPEWQPVALEGTPLAVGWVDEGPAVVSVVGDELVLTHGESGMYGENNRPARMPLTGSGIQLRGARARLGPYARWWREVNPVEQHLVADPLLVDEAQRLWRISFWCDEGRQRVQAVPVAERVVIVCPLAHGGAGFVGSVRTPARADPVMTGLFQLDRRSLDPILCTEWSPAGSDDVVVGVLAVDPTEPRLVSNRRGSELWLVGPENSSLLFEPRALIRTVAVSPATRAVALVADTELILLECC